MVDICWSVVVVSVEKAQRVDYGSIVLTFTQLSIHLRVGFFIFQSVSLQRRKVRHWRCSLVCAGSWHP